MTAFPVAGSKVHIGTTAADPLTDTYTRIGEVVTVGQFGREYNEITHNPIDERKTFKNKGTYNDGNFSLELARDAGDTGQVAALVGLNVDDNYNIKVELNDQKSTLSSATPTLWYMPCKIMSFPTRLEDADSNIMGTINLSVDGDAIEVPRNPV